MVMVGFLVDIQRLSEKSVKDIKKELGQTYSTSSLFAATDMIALIYLSEEDVAKLAYEPVYGNFALKSFKNSVKALPIIEKETESPVIAGGFEEIVNQLYEMGDGLIQRQIVLLTPDLPDVSTPEWRNTLMAAKEKCISCEFVLVNDRKVPHGPEQIEMWRNTIAETENCSFRLWSSGPVLKELYLKSLVEKMHDTSGDLRYSLFELKAGTVEYVNVESEVQLEKNYGENAAEVDVEVVRVYKINSAAVRARCEAFPVDNQHTPVLLWYPTTFSETHRIMVHGFNIANWEKLGMAAQALRLTIPDGKGNRCILACSYLLSETREKHLSPLYLVVGKVSCMLLP